MSVLIDSAELVLYTITGEDMYIPLNGVQLEAVLRACGFTVEEDEKGHRTVYGMSDDDIRRIVLPHLPDTSGW